MTQMENDGQTESINIINIFNSKSGKEMKHLTKFNFQKSTVEHLVGKIEFMIIEFFRGKSMRFYEA
jgi:hypothetical protein